MLSVEFHTAVIESGNLVKLNLIGKAEIRRSLDEEEATNLLFRLGLPEVPEVGLSPVFKYRLLLGGVGIAYEGESESEGGRQFDVDIADSKLLRSGRPGSL